NAAQRGDIPVIEYVLTKGANVDDADEVGVTPLIESARAGRADAARRLIRAGADVNRRARILGTPLMQAVTYCHADVARVLLELGADPAIQNEFGNDALFYAASSADEESLDVVEQYMEKARQSVR